MPSETMCKWEVLMESGMIRSVHAYTREQALTLAANLFKGEIAQAIRKADV